MASMNKATTHLELTWWFSKYILSWFPQYLVFPYPRIFFFITLALFLLLLKSVFNRCYLRDLFCSSVLLNRMSFSPYTCFYPLFPFSVSKTLCLYLQKRKHSENKENKESIVNIQISQGRERNHIYTGDLVEYQRESRTPCRSHTFPKIISSSRTWGERRR